MNFYSLLLPLKSSENLRFSDDFRWNIYVNSFAYIRLTLEVKLRHDPLWAKIFKASKFSKIFHHCYLIYHASLSDKNKENRS